MNLNKYNKIILQYSHNLIMFMSIIIIFDINDLIK